MRGAQRGDTFYPVVQWLNDSGVTPPRVALARLKKRLARAGRGGNPLDERDTLQRDRGP